MLKQNPNKMRMNIVLKLISNLFKRPLTVRFPSESLSIPSGYRGKHIFDPTKCLGCGNCARVCPNRAIEMIEIKQNNGTIKKQPKVNINKCCFCRLCEDACPTKAIHLTKRIPLAEEPASAIEKEKVKLKE